MGKQVTMTDIKNENSIYDEFVEFPVTVGEDEHIVKLYPFFKPETVRDMLNELLQFIKNCESEKVKVKDEEFDEIIGYFIVRHFTDIKMTKSKKAKKIYEEYKIAINSKLFDVILKTIPEESMDYVREKLYEIQEVSVKFENKFKQLQQQMQDIPLENRDILFPQQDTENKNVQ